MKVFLFSAIIFLGPILTSHCLLCIYCFTSLGRFTGFYSEYEPNFFQRIARAVRTDYDFSRTDIVFNLLSRLLLLQKRAARLLLDADFSQPSVSLFSKLKWLPIFDLIKLRKLVLLFTILNNPDAPLCLQRKFNFLSSVCSTGLRTRACAFHPQVPYPRSNSGKHTFAYSAATVFNCLDSDLKQIACVSPY